MLVLGLWLAAASAPTDSTQRGQTFSCSAEPDPIELSTNDPKKLYEEDFRMPMGVRYWGLEGVRFRTPGDSNTAEPIGGRIIFEGKGDNDESFGLYATYNRIGSDGQSESQRFWVYYPSLGPGPEFEGVKVDVIEKVATADTLGLVLRGLDGELEREYRIHISGRQGKGTFERLERRSSGPWRVRLSYRLTK